MSDVTAILPKGQGIGFTLAGVRVREIPAIVDAGNALAEELDNEHNGVILIDEAMIAALSSKLRKRVDESTVPLIVGIPVITEWEYVHDRRDVIENIIRRAVGYRIKLSGD